MNGKMFCVVLVAGLVLSAGAAAAGIDTTPSWNGNDSVSSFGYPNTATYGQTITAPAAGATLQSFTFYMNLPASCTFQGEVYAWDGTKAIGPALWEGPPTQTTGSSTYEAITFTTLGGVSLSPSAQYVLFASVSKLSGSGQGSWGFILSDVYSGGNFVFINNGNDPTQWTSTSWNQYAYGDLAFKAVFGSPWAVLANVSDDTIDTIDLSTNTVYGPFLGGSLGSGLLLDVAVTPDGHYALVSNFGGKTVYRVDLANPASPVLAGSVSVPIYAEDIAISPDGTFAMVTDAGAATQICVINLSTFTLQTTYTVPGSTYINAIAIAPDNQTWVAADYGSSLIFYGTYGLGPGFSLAGSLSTPSPLNVTISPDGQTALVANVSNASVSAFSITGPGVLAAGNTVGGLPGSPQSIAFSPGGATAYVDSVNCPDAISWLTVTAPGAISLGAAGVASLSGFCGSTYYGVDGLAVTPDGQRLVVGNTGGTSAVDLVDTSAFGVTNLATPGSYPAGVATFMSFSGTVNPYNLHFKDDYGRSEMCVNTTVTPAQWKYSVLKGNGTGKTYTGTGTVVNGSGYMRLTASAGSGYGLNLIYYTTAHRATGTFTYRPDAVSSALYDSNTQDDGPCP